MLKLLCITIFVACGQCFDNNVHLCDEIQSIKCATGYTQSDRDEVVCGSNSVTYKNFCYYSQARCATPTVHIAYVGPCGAPTTTRKPTTVTPTTVATTTTTAATTMAPAGTTKVVTTTTTAPIVTISTNKATTTPAASTTTTPMATTTADPLLQVFCSSKDSVACSTSLDPVCGSDTNFYLNKCEFSKAKCDNSALVPKDIDFCTTRK